MLSSSLARFLSRSPVPYVSALIALVAMLAGTFMVPVAVSASGSPSPQPACIPAIDFETDADGAAIPLGAHLDDEYSDWGVHISTNLSGHPAMAFPSHAPTGGDTNLGSPNVDFGGPGIGPGGESGGLGPNKEAHRNIAIVSEDFEPPDPFGDPDDEADGGTIIFEFDTPIRIYDVGILDIDDGNGPNRGKIRTYDSSGSLISMHWLNDKGNNSYQRILIDDVFVSKMTVKFKSSGGVTDIVFCLPDCMMEVEFPVDLSSIYLDLTPVALGPLGTLSFTANMTNIGTEMLFKLRTSIAELENSNLLLNAHQGPSGVGGMLIVPELDDYGDGELDPTETAGVDYLVGLASTAQFDFLVWVECLTMAEEEPPQTSEDGFVLKSSDESDRDPSADLHGATISGPKYVFLDDPGTLADQVKFYLDEVFVNTENYIPWDFKKGTFAWDTTTETNGEHEIRAQITKTSGEHVSVSSTFTIDN